MNYLNLLENVEVVMKTFRVGTFYYEGDSLCVSNIYAYTKCFDERWNYCIVYPVEAETGKQAKCIAREIRLKHERIKRWKKRHQKGKK